MTYLNRHQYRGILFGPAQPGNSNWYNIFSKIFIGWDFSKINSYFLNFFNLNLIASHNKKEVLKPEHQSDLYQYMVDSIKFIKNINESYSLFFEQLQKRKIEGSTEFGYYFSLNNFNDKDRLQPVFISSNNKDRITKLFEMSRTNIIDLSDPKGIEQRYGVKYREFFAILYSVLKESPSELKIKNIKWNHPSIIIEIK